VCGLQVPAGVHKTECVYVCGLQVPAGVHKTECVYVVYNTGACRCTQD